MGKMDPMTVKESTVSDHVICERIESIFSKFKREIELQRKELQRERQEKERLRSERDESMGDNATLLLETLTLKKENNNLKEKLLSKEMLCTQLKTEVQTYKEKARKLEHYVTARLAVECVNGKALSEDTDCTTIPAPGNNELSRVKNEPPQRKRRVNFMVHEDEGLLRVQNVSVVLERLSPSVFNQQPDINTIENTDNDRTSIQDNSHINDQSLEVLHLHDKDQSENMACLNMQSEEHHHVDAEISNKNDAVIEDPKTQKSKCGIALATIGTVNAHKKRYIHLKNDKLREPPATRKSVSKCQIICHICEKVFVTKSGFKSHRCSHPLVKTDENSSAIIQQKINEEANESMEDMKRVETISTMSDNPNNESGSLKCNICGRKFRSLYNLVTHRKIHEEKTSFDC